MTGAEGFSAQAGVSGSEGALQQLLQQQKLKMQESV
jgi:hypothetical protein